MRFWTFGGRKKKILNKLQEQTEKLAREKLEEESMARTDSTRARDLEKAPGMASKPQSNEGSKKLSKAAPENSSNYSRYAPPSRNQNRSAPAGSSSNRHPPPKTLLDHFGTHEPVWSSDRGSTDAASSMYRQNPASHSRSSIGPENFNVIKTPPTLRRRSDQEPSVPRHKSSKRKAEEHAREREVRAMSSPIPVPQRSGTRSEGPLRKETKRIPGDLNAHLERPKAEVSLPLPESFSEMNDMPDQHSFKVNAFAILSPRPTIKYNGSSRLASPRAANQSRASARQLIVEEDFSSKKRIDDLADTLDSGGLRELMERDQRHREKKRESDKAKLHRKLQRRADRQREDEQRRARGLDARPQTPKGKTVKRPSGLGLDTNMIGSPTAGTTEQVQDEERFPSSRPIAASTPPEPLADVDPSTDPGAEDSSVQGHVAIPQDSQQIEPVVNPFSHEEDKEELAVDATGNPVPHQEENGPTLPHAAANPNRDQARELSDACAQTPLRTNQFEQSRLSVIPSPPTSPVQAPADRSTFPEQPALGRKTTPEIRESTEPEKQRGSGQGSALASNWTTFFKKGGRRKRSSTDRGRTTPEFSNTSRESFSRQQPPPVVPPKSFRRSGSGAPQRTRSKFREDLPELPISPPDSRVQSPETVPPPVHHATTVPRPGSMDQGQSALLPTDGRSLTTSSSIPEMGRTGSRHSDRLSQARSMDFASFDAPAGAPGLSQSLASVDSEASWLSGKPAKRNSLPLGHALRQSQSSLQQNFASAAAAAEPSDEREEHEENDVANDEYFHRLTPAPEETRRTSDTSAMRKASSTVLDLGEDDELSPEHDVPPLPDRKGETWHGSVGRQPTIVRQTSRAISKEGLLNQYMADDPELSSPDEGAGSPEVGSPEFETPAEEFPDSPILRARSVDYGKGHARHISAGSARLLDIRRSSVVLERGLETPTTARSLSALRSGEEGKLPE